MSAARLGGCFIAHGELAHRAITAEKYIICLRLIGFKLGTLIGVERAELPDVYRQSLLLLATARTRLGVRPCLRLGATYRLGWSN